MSRKVYECEKTLYFKKKKLYYLLGKLLVFSPKKKDVFLYYFSVRKYLPKNGKRCERSWRREERKASASDHSFTLGPTHTFGTNRYLLAEKTTATTTTHRENLVNRKKMTLPPETGSKFYTPRYGGQYSLVYAGACIKHELSRCFYRAYPTPYFFLLPPLPSYSFHCKNFL